MMERCHVCAPGCLGQCGTKCFRCGLAACRECSKLRDYVSYGRKRICDDCAEEIGLDKKESKCVHCGALIVWREADPIWRKKGVGSVECASKFPEAEKILQRQIDKSKAVNIVGALYQLMDEFRHKHEPMPGSVK